MLIYMIIYYSTISNPDAGDIMARIAHIFTLPFVILIVAIPEGLPMAIGISLAFSVMKMKKDKILVKTLESPEVMGRVDEICTGKTATLTKGTMKVGAFYAQSMKMSNLKSNTFTKGGLS